MVWPGSQFRVGSRICHAPRGALWTVAIPLLIHSLGGCSGDDDGGPAATAGAAGMASTPGGPGPTDLSYNACAESGDFGGFEVEITSGAVQGQVFDGVFPSRVPADLRTVGDCRLRQGQNLFCDPACGASQVCGEDGTCSPSPAAKNIGAVVVSGAKTSAGASEISLEPTASQFYATRATLAEPPFAPGDPVTLNAAGSEYLPAFSLRGEGIAPLVIPEGDIAVEAGKPLALRWDAPPNKTAARVEIKLQFNLHGSTTAAFIDCSVADTGAFDVPAELVDELLSRELSGFPTATFARRTADSRAAGSGCIDFLVSSRVTRALSVPGISSCNEDEDCAPGQTCTRPRLVCE
jgi:hypothetical protein